MRKRHLPPFLAAVTLLLAGMATGGQVALTGPAAAVTPAPVHFTAAGDYSSSTAAGAVLDKIGTIAPDLNLALGDFSYGVAGQEQQWCDFVTSRVGATLPFELVSGNHESNGVNGNIGAFAACLPNRLPGLVGTYGKQWYVDVPADNPTARFVMISPALKFPDGKTSYAAGTPDYNWTAAAIDGAHAAGIPWVVVGFHKPCLSISGAACESGPDLMNLLVSKRVDLVLSGHVHLYDRTKQLSHSAACPALVPGRFSAACVADGDSTMTQGAGTVFATVATGGVAQQKPNPADPEAPYFAAWAGSSANRTWGMMDVTADANRLSATFVPVTGGSFTDSFTINRTSSPTQNQAPRAQFAVDASGLRASFDGSSSTDADGAVASYAWDFGDGTSATGARPAHTYSKEGTFQARLTVTDDSGATGSVTQAVTVTTTPAAATFASDAFGRTVTGGWGTADDGGKWSVGGGAASFSVAQGVGQVRLSPGASPLARLNSLSSTDTEVALDLSVDKPATGGGDTLSVIGRRAGTAGDYRLKLRYTADNHITAQLVRVAGSKQTILKSLDIPGLGYLAGDVLHLRFQVTGTSGTTLAAKVWKDGTSEPAGWNLTASDSTAALQAPGSIGVLTYLAANATNAPVTVSVDNLRAGPVQVGTP